MDGTKNNCPDELMRSISLVVSELCPCKWKENVFLKYYSPAITKSEKAISA